MCMYFLHMHVFLSIVHLFFAGTVELSGEVMEVQVVFIESVVSFYVQRIGEGYSVSKLMNKQASFQICVVLSLSLSLPPPPPPPPPTTTSGQVPSHGEEYEFLFV